MPLGIHRDENGRVLPGSKLNAGGEKQYSNRREELAERARNLLGREASPADMAALGVPEVARAWLPEDATLEDALLAVTVAEALGGDRHARRDLLARLWPA